MGDRTSEANTLTNIGNVYSSIRQPQKALDYYKQSLPISQEVGDRPSEASILSYIGLSYIAIGQLQKAITYLEQSLTRALEVGVNIKKDERISFLQSKRGIRNALIDSLIKSNQVEDAYKWANLLTTVDLVDYTRLVNAKVKDPKAQKAIDEWNQLNQQLQLVREKNQEKHFSKRNSLRIRELETQLSQEGEQISKDFPQVAEIFETTPIDIKNLQASIPEGTTVIHPILLTMKKEIIHSHPCKIADPLGFSLRGRGECEQFLTENIPNTIALFILTKDSLKVKQVFYKPDEFNKLVEQTFDEQLTNRYSEKYLYSLEKLYDLLIGSVEDKIQLTKSKELSIIASGVLRYIPFDALYDSKKDQYLLEKYPVSYLTRLSVHSLQSRKTSNSTSQKRILGFGNPSPKGSLALPGAETEVKKIADIIPGSKYLIGEKATFDSFKVLALQFPLLHLATHACFHRGGCPTLKLDENVLVFADQQLKISDAARLGLENVDLATLSACGTAIETDSAGQAIIDDHEGSITGLAYLFERAGAKAVIANLWSIDDQATQEVMVKFYYNLKQGMSKTEALRQAKLNQIQRHPFFWSSFVLIGDPN